MFLIYFNTVNRFISQDTFIGGITHAIFKDKYQVFTKEWYTDAGFTITFLIISALAEPFYNLSGVVIFHLKTCIDRGFTCNKKKTGKILQDEYELVNTPGEFILTNRYAFVLKILAVVMLYSGGMPILYILAAFIFFFQYWMDKILLFSFYTKPPSYDEKTSEQTLGTIKTILAMHIVMTAMLYGMTPMFTKQLRAIVYDVWADFKELNFNMTP